MLGFQLKNFGELRGLFFPSGYRILNVHPCVIMEEEFYLENWNFYNNNFCLLSALIPSKPIVGRVHDCELIVIKKYAIILVEVLSSITTNVKTKGKWYTVYLLCMGNHLEQNFIMDLKQVTDTLNVR